ncbi:Signal transduction histidine kinase (fragment) [Candidatus Terasakiella magnetica]
MMSKVVEQSPVSVVITDAAGAIQYVNRHFTEVTGYGSDEVMGQNPRILGSGQTAPEVYVKMWATIVRGGTWVGELLNRRKDTNLYWETVAISPIMNDEGGIAHYVAVKADISYRKEADAKIAESNRLLEEQALQLKRSNEELEQFAYVASHDLRQPLRMIASYLTLTERELGDTIGEEVRSYLNFAIDGAKRMDVMIRDLLEYSRIGRKDDNFEALPLAEVMADCLLNLEVAIKEAGGVVAVAQDLPMVWGDRSELLRLFQNLIGNAVKYHAPDRLPVVEIAWSDQGADWLFTVKDNGIGIAARDYERAFGIFQRLVARDAYEGSGIGLSVCKKIVQHHGGRVWLESELGVGTIFFVALPKRAHDGNFNNLSL